MVIMSVTQNHSIDGGQIHAKFPGSERKALPKDRAKLSTILKDLHTIDNSIDNFVIDDEEDF